SKFVPVIVTDAPVPARPTVPATPELGVKPVMVGVPELVLTVKLVALAAEPPGVVTVIGPVVAPEGTEVTIWVVVADVTVATVPLNLTVFWLAVVLNPVP